MHGGDRRGELVVVFGHHTLGSMTNPTPDEAAGACQPADGPGCDADPRDSEPLHLGTTGSATVRSLLARKCNVIAFVGGHTHINEIDFVAGPRGGGEDKTGEREDRNVALLVRDPR